MDKVQTLAQRIVEQYLSSPLANISQILGKGEVNQVFVLTLESSQRYILRLNEVSETERFKKERWCIDTTLGKGVKGAKVIASGIEHEFAYMLLEYIEGSNGVEINSTPQLWEKLGQYLKLIHSVSSSGFGENLTDIQSGDHELWEKYLEYNIDSLGSEDKLIGLSVLTTSTSNQLRKLFESILATEFKFGLSHGDYSLSNIIVDDTNDPYIIDWGSAEAHVVPHYDLSVITDESLEEDSAEFEALLTGYGLTLTDYGAIRDDVKKLQLLESVDKLRWAIDKSPDRIDYYKKRVLGFLKDLGIE